MWMLGQHKIVAIHLAMEELFQALSSSARLDKSKRPKKRRRQEEEEKAAAALAKEDEDVGSTAEATTTGSRDRTGKRDTSIVKQQQVHREQIAAFRRSMNIRLGNKHDPDIPDPLSSFDELKAPKWWKDDETSFGSLTRAIIRNIESGRWKEPTPIQMQSIPTLLERRDVIGAAPTGSGKSGAFILPSLLLSSVSDAIFYGQAPKKTKKNSKKDSVTVSPSIQGEIRCLLLAPSLELASQLHREVERLGTGKPGGLTSFLLSKANAHHAITGKLGGKSGIDVLISTPLRLVDSIEKGLKLNGVRSVILDEADRLLDAADGRKQDKVTKKGQSDSNAGDSDKKEDDRVGLAVSSGSAQSRSFLSQMDIILSEVPDSAVRGLFSATVTPMVRSLSESILRSPVDISVASGTAANTDIDQQLMFVGREEGKLLAVRQLVARGQLHPPAIIFLQSQERAQALFEELLYDKMHVDVIHAGRSRSAREKAVANFRKGDTWVLICTDLVARGVDFRAVNMVINYDLPTSGITYVHRIGRTGRAGRKGKAITLFTEADFDHLRTIANIVNQSGCNVEDWMLNLKKAKGKGIRRTRRSIDTTPSYDKKKKRRKEQIVRESKQKQIAQKGTPEKGFPRED
jgi:ATP-dependent RNA helicase DDX52/ROK1